MSHHHASRLCLFQSATEHQCRSKLCVRSRLALCTLTHQISLELVGFVLLRDCTTDPVGGGSVLSWRDLSPPRHSSRNDECTWMRADGTALECMLGMSAAQFCGILKENRARSIEVGVGRQAPFAALLLRSTHE